MKKIGLLGGTFDPVHRGHLHIAEAAFREYALDELWFLVAGEPYFKAKKAVTPAWLRLEMTKACLMPYAPRFSCCDIEVKRPGKTYTATTLTELCRLYPDARFFFVMGADSLFQIETWYEPQLIFESAVILCADRTKPDDNGSDVPDTGSDVTAEKIEYLKARYAAHNCDIRLLHTPLMDISSTDIRMRAAKGEDITKDVTPEVFDFIRAHGLYDF